MAELNIAEIGNTQNSDMQPNTAPKKRNIFARLWFYFSTYEKIWLATLWTLGIVLTIIFPDLDGIPDNMTTIAIVLSVITLIGGCSCELLLSKQTKWAFIVSFFLYDLTCTALNFIAGKYPTAVMELIFWMPMLFISFFTWDKRRDKENQSIAVVKNVKYRYRKELLIFIAVLVASVGISFAFTYVEGMTEAWELEALVVAFNVCNGLFLWLRYREQWIAWYGVVIVESIMWAFIYHVPAMLILQLGYLTNTTYGFFKWGRYIKKHKNQDDYLGKDVAAKPEIAIEE